MSTTPKTTYGVLDSSYKLAGELSGITKLVNCFYDNMAKFDESTTIFKMHPKDNALSRKKLTYFLSGWLGGPKLYAEHFGSINIPQVHQHLAIGSDERNAWLLCMEKAIQEQPYDKGFKEYLLTQLSIPADRIVATARKPMSIKHRNNNNHD